MTLRVTNGESRVPCILLVAAKEALPKIPAPVDRDQGLFLQSVAGQEFFAGNWLWFAVIVTMMIFNTVLGEELLFRGLLLPRMRGAFGKWDWLVNGVLFGIFVHTVQTVIFTVPLLALVLR